MMYSRNDAALVDAVDLSRRLRSWTMSFVLNSAAIQM